MTRQGWPIGRAALVGACAAAAMLLAGLLSPDAYRLPLVAGALTGAAGGGLGLALVSGARGRPLNALLLAQVLGFLGRILLVGVGLVVVSRSGADWPPYVASFFFLFFLFVALEAAVLGSPAQPTPSDRSVPQ